MSNFQQGSESLLRSIVSRTKAGATSVIGGGDTANLANKFGLQDEVSYISTGGGATL
jgi:phosphoglycerate kinase